MALQGTYVNHASRPQKATNEVTHTCLAYNDFLLPVLCGIYVQCFYRIVLPTREIVMRRGGGEETHRFSVVCDDASLARDPEDGGGTHLGCRVLRQRAPGLW
jgi:hypothetical protein